ncbi:MAG: FRG domain-containing protein [Planctomycetaceae bacterium]|nr:FRG domain-containing protein [Planctomycetaceae bacterium]
MLPHDDADVWALGQHYGLKTPYLDWTLSPYIAAYFAFKDEIESDDNYRYVFALNRSIKLLISKRKKASQVLSSDRSVPFVDRLSHPSPRFVAQKGIFTEAFQGNDIQEYVPISSRKRSGEVVIVKFRIPTSDREQCLRALHLMNIDHTSLLLDFGDVVERCNNILSPVASA